MVSGKTLATGDKPHLMLTGMELSKDDPSCVATLTLSPLGSYQWELIDQDAVHEEGEHCPVRSVPQQPQKSHIYPNLLIGGFPQQACSGATRMSHATGQRTFIDPKGTFLFGFLKSMENNQPLTLYQKKCINELIDYVTSKIPEELFQEDFLNLEKNRLVFYQKPEDRAEATISIKLKPCDYRFLVPVTLMDYNSLHKMIDQIPGSSNVLVIDSIKLRKIQDGECPIYLAQDVIELSAPSLSAGCYISVGRDKEGAVIAGNRGFITLNTPILGGFQHQKFALTTDWKRISDRISESSLTIRLPESSKPLMYVETSSPVRRCSNSNVLPDSLVFPEGLAMCRHQVKEKFLFQQAERALTKEFGAQLIEHLRAASAPCEEFDCRADCTRQL